ncbi:hypothetical protein VCHENC02_4844B, partial [Vibrio harveyi]
ALSQRVHCSASLGLSLVLLILFCKSIITKHSETLVRLPRSNKANHLARFVN